jgi:branched-subunit amino acid transport protein
MNEFLLIAGMAIVTFATRYPVLAFLSRRSMPAGVFGALKYVPPAVLSAIIFPAVLLSEGEFFVSCTNAPLIASFVSALIGWLTRNLLITILVGMASFWLWRLVLLNFL